MSVRMNIKNQATRKMIQHFVFANLKYANKILIFTSSMEVQDHVNLLYNLKDILRRGGSVRGKGKFLWCWDLFWNIPSVLITFSFVELLFYLLLLHVNLQLELMFALTVFIDLFINQRGILATGCNKTNVNQTRRKNVNAFNFFSISFWWCLNHARNTVIVVTLRTLYGIKETN